MKRVLIANRGEIASRVIRTCERLGLESVAVYSSVDAEMPFVREASFSREVGAGPVNESYLNMERILTAASEVEADAIHPGYGFLSENPHFAERVESSGLLWIGPSAQTMRMVADKGEARTTMNRVGVPINEGRVVGPDHDVAGIVEEVGFPLILKSCSGGGGLGMQVVVDPGQLDAAIQRGREFGERFFGSQELLVERYLPKAKHVEVQVMGHSDGTVTILGERECSVQRRYQKLVEEAPCVGISATVRERLHSYAQAGAQEIGYLGAGTFEFLVSGSEIAFLEVNARIQVEHPVTELTSGVDIVEQQIFVASGGKVGVRDRVTHAPWNHALELRVYAEDSDRFLPSPGLLERFVIPTSEGVRVEAAYCEGNTVSRFYDPLLAKICIAGHSRDDAIRKAIEVIDTVVIEGVKTNLTFLRQVLLRDAFADGTYDIQLVSQMKSGA